MKHPSDDEIHALHDRYLHALIEDLNLCPFARKARLDKRVERPLLRLDLARPPKHIPDPTSVHDVMEQTLTANPKTEIILLTFILPTSHPWHTQSAFRRFMQTLSAHHKTTDLERFYMACFHPDPPQPSRPIAMTPARLVHSIRRTPDPVIQCVRASILHPLRAQFKAQAQARYLASIEDEPPELRAILREAVGGVETLSESIDRKNFRAVSDPGPHRERFESILEEIHAERALLFAPDDHRQESPKDEDRTDDESDLV